MFDGSYHIPEGWKPHKKTKHKNTDVNQKVTNEPITVVYMFNSEILMMRLGEEQGFICFVNRNDEKLSEIKKSWEVVKVDSSSNLFIVSFYTYCVTVCPTFSLVKQQACQMFSLVWSVVLERTIFFLWTWPPISEFH